jgi:hypothetical protein
MSYLVGQMKNLPSLHDITCKSIPHGHNDMRSNPKPSHTLKQWHGLDDKKYAKTSATNIMVFIT